MVHNHSNANKRTDFEHSYLLLFIYLFIFRFLLDVTNSHFFGYLFNLCLHKQKPKQTNKNSTKIHIHYQDLNPRHRDDTLSDFNNYIKFYIIMSASHEFTICVFSIY